MVPANQAVVQAEAALPDAQMLLLEKQHLDFISDQVISFRAQSSAV
jgi:hypothetical protein